MDGLKCAPDRLPIGAWIIRIAVIPIAMPINIRRTIALGSRLKAGYEGSKRKTVNEHVESVKIAGSIASNT